MVSQVLVALFVTILSSLVATAPTSKSFNFTGVTKTVNGATYKDCSGTVSYGSFNLSPFKPLCVDAKSVKVTNLKCKSPQIPAGVYPINMTDVPFNYGTYKGKLSGTGQFDVPKSGPAGTVNIDKATVCQAF